MAQAWWSRLWSISGVFQPKHCQFFYRRNLFNQTPLQNGKIVSMKSARRCLLWVLISFKHAHVSKHCQLQSAAVLLTLYVLSCLTFHYVLMNEVNLIRISECLTERCETLQCFLFKLSLFLIDTHTQHTAKLIRNDSGMSWMRVC